MIWSSGGTLSGTAPWRDDPMSHAALVFAAPYRVEVQRSSPGIPGPGEALVKTLVSAISSGTEMLLYRGQMPGEMAVDESIAALNGTFQYPIKYGYAAVGRVEEMGEGGAGVGVGDVVFSFRPHESSFVSPASELIKAPEGVTAEDAAFLPTMETAVNLVMDGQPSIGEQVAVFGQGVVGLLVTALLSEMPLASLVTVDQYEGRRRESVALGANASLAPDDPILMGALQASRDYRGADLSFELSGNPAALDQAVKTAGYNGRIVVGSWYGTKESRLDLGGRFHRDRVRLISSQVSTIAPEWSGRWSKERRFDLAWSMIKKVRPSRLVSHRFSIDDAGSAYELLDRDPAKALQVLFTYDN